MSKFTKALEQAQRERALRSIGAPPPSPAAPPAPPSAASGAPAPAPKPMAAAPEPAPVTSTPPRQRPLPPRLPATVSDEVDSHLVSLVSPAGLEAEQYRALRLMIEQKHKTDNLSVIAVSSPGVGDGKTTTAINLAGALAQGTDNSVLLVEADLRRPSIAQVLGFSSSGIGLVDAILDPTLALSDIVQTRPPFNLSVVLSGQTPPSPYEVLKLPRLGALLDEAREHFDYIVLDTPPLVPVQDCRVLARWVDGVVLVVAADHTPRALIEAALDILDPGRVVGLVFNGFDHLLSGRYANSYSGYYAQPAAAVRPSMLGRVRSGVGSLLHRGEDAGRRSRRAQDRSR
jgi:receptor protein-tyrosine kinase